MSDQPPIVLGISGASGVIYGVEILKALNSLKRPVHLIISEAAALNLEIETDYTADQVRALADVSYDPKNMAAGPASGSFKTAGMIVAPCSIKTLSSVANSFNSDLMSRAADVCLKERRKLVLMVRETPLHAGHLELMAKVSHLGGIILPPVPAFYHKPQSVRDIVRQSVGKALDQLDVAHDLFERWKGR